MRRIQTWLRLAFPLLAASIASAQTTWFVDASALPPGNGTPASPYTSIHDAANQPTTLTGDTLSIAAGTYAERVEQSHFKSLTYLAPSGPLATLVTGGMSVPTNALGTLTTIEGLGFTTEPVRLTQAPVVMRDCRITDVDNASGGFGMFLFFATVTLEDCVVADNGSGGIGTLTTALILRNVSFTGNGPGETALSVQGGSLLAEDCFFLDNDLVDGSGGALRLGAKATLRRCDFADNSAYLTGRQGGAIYVLGGGPGLTAEDCTFQGNRSDMGGAIALSSNGQASLIGCTFSANVAVRDGTGMLPGQGGAIFVGATSKLLAEDCLFQQNSAPASGFGTGPGDQLGGAVYAEGPESLLRRCSFVDNQAQLGGSALFGAVTLEQCALLSNDNLTSGGTVEGGALLDRCTLVKNDTAAGTAAVVDSTVTGSIVWANANGQLGGSSSATYSCIQGGAAGVGNTSADPLFVDLANDQLSLLQGSPCIDAAQPTAPLDADLTPADMGALPFTWLPIGTSYCSTNPNSSGQTAVIAALGSASVGDDFLRVQATQTALNQVGLFIMSQNQGFVPFFNGSQGNLCVSAPIFRLTNTPGSVSSSGAQGLLNLRVGLTTLPAGLAILPGQTWHFQSWFRDTVASQSTSNTSDAVSVTFQ